MFLRYNKSEQLEFKLEKHIGIQKHAGKVRKKSSCTNGAIATKPDLGNVYLVYETGYDHDIFIKKILLELASQAQVINCL